MDSLARSTTGDLRDNLPYRAIRHERRRQKILRVIIALLRLDTMDIPLDWLPPGLLYGSCVGAYAGRNSDANAHPTLGPGHCQSDDADHIAQNLEPEGFPILSFSSSSSSSPSFFSFTTLSIGSDPSS